MPRSTKAMEYAQSRNLNYGKLGIGYSGANIGKAWNNALQISAAQIGVLRKAMSIMPKEKEAIAQRFNIA